MQAEGPKGTARRTGWVERKRYPSIAFYGDDGFRGAQPILRSDRRLRALVAARDSTSRFGGDEVDISGLQMQINC